MCGAQEIDSSSSQDTGLPRWSRAMVVRRTTTAPFLHGCKSTTRRSCGHSVPPRGDITACTASHSACQFAPSCEHTVKSAHPSAATNHCLCGACACTAAKMGCQRQARPRMPLATGTQHKHRVVRFSLRVLCVRHINFLATRVRRKARRSGKQWSPRASSFRRGHVGQFAHNGGTRDHNHILSGEHNNGAASGSNKLGPVKCTKANQRTTVPSCGDVQHKHRVQCRARHQQQAILLHCRGILSKGHVALGVHALSPHGRVKYVLHGQGLHHACGWQGWQEIVHSQRDRVVQRSIFKKKTLKRPWAS